MTYKNYHEKFEDVQPMLVVLLCIVQALVIYVWQSHVSDYERTTQTFITHAESVDAEIQDLRVFEAETVANRFTSQDALRMNQSLVETLNKLESELKRCIRTKDC